MGIRAIRRVSCACVARTSMLYKPWISGIPLDAQYAINQSLSALIGQY